MIDASQRYSFLAICVVSFDNAQFIAYHRQILIQKAEQAEEAENIFPRIPLPLHLVDLRQPNHSSISSLGRPYLSAAVFSPPGVSVPWSAADYTSKRGKAVLGRNYSVPNDIPSLLNSE
jgi:hypothetical protein